MRKACIISLILSVSITLTGCQFFTNANVSPSPSVLTVASPDTNIKYENKNYGFNFSLPVSWTGYSIVKDEWQGYAITGDNKGNVIDTGSVIAIRNPKWTEADPRQDIPIMIFTIAQWNLVQSEEMSVSSAPISPTELGRNSKYVFALPARYDYAYLTGYEEVQKILEGKPLKAVQ